MKVSFEGVGEQVLSFNKASGVTKGALVKMSANSTVSSCTPYGRRCARILQSSASGRSRRRTT